MTYMFLLGFGVIALFVLVFATWTTNVINLYSTALASRASIPIGNYRNVVVLTGIVGTAAALVGIADNLIEFLVVMGLLVPPIAGVYLADFFYFKRTDFSAGRLENRPPIRINAVVIGLGTGVVSTWMFYTERSLTSIGAVDSLLISIVAYIVLQKLTGRGWAANLADEASGTRAPLQ
jgi:cytosine permease